MQRLGEGGRRAVFGGFPGLTLSLHPPRLPHSGEEPGDTRPNLRGREGRGRRRKGVSTPSRASASAAPPLPSAGLPLGLPARPARAGSEPRAARRADSLEAGAAREGAGGGAEPGAPARSPPGPDRAAGAAGSAAPRRRWGEMPALRGTAGAARPRPPRCRCQGPAAYEGRRLPPRPGCCSV